MNVMVLSQLFVCQKTDTDSRNGGCKLGMLRVTGEAPTTLDLLNQAHHFHHRQTLHDNFYRHSK